MIEKKLERPEYAADPNRCQASGQGGQCPYMAVQGGVHCQRHGGTAELKNQEATKIRIYRLEQYQARVDELVDHDHSKKLDEEIGILRMVLESVLNHVKTPLDLLINSGKISDILMKIEKLISSCVRLEKSNNSMLDQNKAIILGQTIVEIISRYITDADALDDISDEIILAITKVGQEVVPITGK